MSTTIAQTFECEKLEDKHGADKRWLRAQLTLSCEHSRAGRPGWEAYATFMAVLFPVRRAI